MEAILLFFVIIIFIYFRSEMNKASVKIEKMQREVDTLKFKLKEISEAEKQETKVSEAVPPPPPPLYVVKPQMVMPNSQIPENKRKSYDFEKLMGENVFGKIGILILVVGIGLFVKYAIDNEWISETVRTVLGFACGVVLLGFAFWLKDRYRTFSSLLSGGGFAVFYVTVAMAYHYYGLFSQTAAFVMLVIFSIFMICISLIFDRRELASIALVGGFIAPFLVSEGTEGIITLFAYMAVLDMSMFTISFYKRWGELPLFCTVLTWFLCLSSIPVYWEDEAEVAKPAMMFGFVIAYYLMFQLSALLIVKSSNRWANTSLLALPVVNSLIFWILADRCMLYFEPYIYFPVFSPVFIALVNMVLYVYFYINHRDKRNMLQMLLGLVLLAMVTAVPVQLEGSFVTLFWTIETLVAVWLFSRFGNKLYRFAALALLLLTFFSWSIDCYVYDFNERLFINGYFLTSCFVSIAFILVSVYCYQKALSDILPFGIVAGLVLYSSVVIDLIANLSERSDLIGWIFLFSILFSVIISFLLYRYRLLPSETNLFYILVSAYPQALCLLFVLALNFLEMEGCYVYLWVGFAMITLYLLMLIKSYYVDNNYKDKATDLVTCFLSASGTVTWVMAVNVLLHQLGFEYEGSAGISVSLAIAVFVMISLGMRKNWKTMRICGFVGFVVLMFKLVAIDLWLLPTIGKVFVFIFIGIVLLVLSFMYQKLKKAIFGERES